MLKKRPRVKIGYDEDDEQGKLELEYEPNDALRKSGSQKKRQKLSNSTAF